MANDSKTIYVDLDDVLCQTARHFLVVIEREFGKQIVYEQLTDFDVGTSCGLGPEERDELYRIVHQPDELMRITPIGEALSTLNHWASQGFEIAIVTGRPPQSFEPSREWLARHRVAHHSFTMVDKYSRFATDDTVAIDLAELAQRRFCWAVEDSLPMAEYLADKMGVPVALVDCPWNRAATEVPRIDRFSDWQMIAHTLPGGSNR